MGLIYEIGLRVFYLSALIGSIFQKKANLWIKGRKGQFRKIKDMIDNSLPLAWFHCASLGEFEQGRPLVEEFKTKYPEYKIMLTFFSPSGFEIRKNYNNADYVFYLPLDINRNAKKFLRLTKPKVAFFIKYEFWGNYLRHLKKNKIPTFLVSAIFRKDQMFFKNYGKWFRRALENFNYLFVQDMESYNLMRGININNVTVSGDTRFDRVYKTLKSKTEVQGMDRFKQDKLILIAGSTWPVDDEIIIRFINETELDVKYIIAPHEISKSHIQYIENTVSAKVLKFSEKTDEGLSRAKVLIIDSIGLLSALYKYGDIAYIGGGFGKGIHNILEAAAFGMPVVFGPNYEKFREAVNLIENGGAFSIENYEGFHQQMVNLMTNTGELTNIGRISRNYVMRNKGITKRIIQVVGDYLPN